MGRKDMNDDAPSLEEVMSLMEGQEVVINDRREPLIVPGSQVVRNVLEQVKADGGDLGPEVEAMLETADDPAPEPIEPPKRRAMRVDPWKVNPKWEAWGISVKATEDEKTETVRKLLAEMEKTGAKTGFMFRADAAIFATRTSEGIFIYDCQARRQAKIPV
jgi:hypothetical protein